MSLDLNIRLYRAASDGDAAAVDECLKKGARVACHDKNGCSPLYLASLYGHHEVVKMLLVAQAPVDKANRLGWTPLITAANNGNVKCVKLLLDAGANPSRRNSDGRNAFDKVRERRRTEDGSSAGRAECFNLLRDALLRSGGAPPSVGSRGSRSSHSETTPSRPSGGGLGSGLRPSSSHASMPSRAESSQSLGSLFDACHDVAGSCADLVGLDAVAETRSRASASSSALRASAGSVAEGASGAGCGGEVYSSSPLTKEQLRLHDTTTTTALKDRHRFRTAITATEEASSSCTPEEEARDAASRDEARARPRGLLETLGQAVAPLLRGAAGDAGALEAAERERAEARARWEAEEAARREAQQREEAARKAAAEEAARASVEAEAAEEAAAAAAEAAARAARVVLPVPTAPPAAAAAAAAAGAAAAKPRRVRRLEGRLLKRSEWLGAWNARYFRLLPGGTLIYFHGEPGGTPDALLRLGGCSIAIAADEGKPGAFGFELKAAGRTLALRAESDEERRQWVEAIQAAA